jgi:hypothetical protein
MFLKAFGATSSSLETDHHLNSCSMSFLPSVSDNCLLFMSTELLLKVSCGTLTASINGVLNSVRLLPRKSETS